MARGVANHPETHQRMETGLEAEMGFPVSEAYGLPVNAKSLVGSVMANVCVQPLSIAHGDGGGIQPKDTSG